MRRPTILDRIRALDPERDHERIVFLSTCYDFPFDTTRALEFALFRTFCVPSDRASARRDRRVPQPRAEALRRYRHHRQRADGTRLQQRARQPGAGAHERAARPLQDRQRRFPLRPLDLHLRADPLERALRLAQDVRDRAARPFPLLACRSASAWGSRTFRPITPPSNATTSTTNSGIPLYRSQPPHRRRNDRNVRELVSAAPPAARAPLDVRDHGRSGDRRVSASRNRRLPCARL